MENLTVYDASSGVIRATGKMAIKNLVEVMSLYKPEQDFTSDTFNVGDNPMAILVFPNGATEKERGYVSIALWNGGDADITVKATFMTDALTWNNDPREFSVKAKRMSGGVKFLSHAQCTAAYKDKDFVVTVTVEIPGEALKISGSGSAADPKKFGVWEKVYSKMEMTDFTLVFEGVEIPCHKHILSAASPVFEAMVKNQHLEAIEGRANIKLSDVVGKAFVRYIYTGELEESLLREEAVPFLELGDKYDVQELKELAEGELLRQLSRKNMVELVSIGDTHNANRILEAALKMTKVNMTWLRSQVCNKRNNEENLI